MCNTTSLFNFLGSRNPVSRLKGKNHIFHSEFPEICLAVNSGRKTEMDDLDFSGELWEVWEVGPSGSNKTSGGEV